MTELSQKEKAQETRIALMREEIKSLKAEIELLKSGKSSSKPTYEWRPVLTREYLDHSRMVLNNSLELAKGLRKFTLNLQEMRALETVLKWLEKEYGPET